METSRNGAHRGFVTWADDELAAHGSNGINGTAKPAENGEAPSLVDRLTESERRAVYAEAMASALRGELDRAQQAARRAETELDTERRAREQAEQARHAAESRLAEAREAVWRWLTRLARTPFWRLRRALAEPPVELQGQPRLAPPSQPEA